MAVRQIVMILQPDDVNYYEWAGLSTDSKPLKGCTGSLFLEVDKGDVYAFDEEAAAGSEWTKIAALGGGS